MAEDSNEGPGPLALLLGAVGQAVPLLRKSGWMTREKKELYETTAAALEHTARAVQPLANLEPKGRCCRACGAALDDLAEIGAELLRMAEGGGVLTGAELEQRACHVAGFCSSSCWAITDPESIPGSSH